MGANVPAPAGAYPDQQGGFFPCLLRLAVLSTSRIVAEFLTHAPAWPELALAALCCRPESAEKGRALAEKAVHPAPCTQARRRCTPRAAGSTPFTSAPPTTCTPRAARRALAAGYHVILEKPFTPTAAEARALFALADEKGVVLFEAITTPYLPTYRFLQAERPKIGARCAARWPTFPPRSARGMTTTCAGCGTRRLTRPVSAGALYDMNVYNLHFFCGLLGAPQRAEYRPTLGGNGIDTAGTVLLQYPRVLRRRAGRQGQRRAAVCHACRALAAAWFCRAAPTAWNRCTAW